MAPVYLWIALGLLGCSSVKSTNLAEAEQKADRLLVVKSEHTMTLMANGRVLKVYKVALGKGPAGKKELAGDNKTPEGKYVIDQKNAKSRFHLALHISYPSAADAKHARDAGVDPGGAIMIHGMENGFGWLGALQHDVDWTESFALRVIIPEIRNLRLVQWALNRNQTFQIWPAKPLSCSFDQNSETYAVPGVFWVISQWATTRP